MDRHGHLTDTDRRWRASRAWSLHPAAGTCPPTPTRPPGSTFTRRTGWRRERIPSVSRTRRSRRRPSRPAPWTARG